MNEKIPFLKKHNSSIAFITSAVLTLLATYVAIGRNINDAVANTPCVQKINSDNRVQDEKINAWEKRMDRFEGKLDRVLERR